MNLGARQRQRLGDDGDGLGGDMAQGFLHGVQQRQQGAGLAGMAGASWRAVAIGSGADASAGVQAKAMESPGGAAGSAKNRLLTVFRLFNMLLNTY